MFPLAYTIIFFLFVSPKSYSAETIPWHHLIEETAKNNAEIQSAQHSLESSRDLSKAAYSGFLPQISGDVNYSRGATSSTANPSPDASDSYGVTLTASQNLFAGFQDKAKVNQTAATARSSEANLEITKAKISYDLISAYANLLYSQNSIKLQLDISKRREENLKLVELRFQSGRENKGSVLLSQAYLNQAHYESLQAKNGTSTYQSQLARVLGREDSEDISIIDDIPLSLPSPHPDYKALAIGTPDHKQSVAQVEVADAVVSSSRASFFPSLNLSASVGKLGSEWFPQYDKWSVGATLSFPLFTGGKDYYNLSSASSNLLAADETRHNVDRQILAKLKQTYTAYIESIEKLKVDESFRAAALKRAEIARSKYNNGLMTFEDWDVIENDLISRQRTVLQSQRDRIIAEAAWQQSLGKGVLQ